MADNDSPQPTEGTHVSANIPIHEEFDPFDPVPTYAIDRLSHAFETSARRWELIVYPSMFAFIVLAAYGFYLVFSLAKDMHYLTISVDSNMTAMSSNLQAVSNNMQQLTNNIRSMTVQVESMSHNVSALDPMLLGIQQMDKSMQSMTSSIQSMNFTIHNIRGDTSSMSRTSDQVGRPMSFFNSFAPW